MFFEEIRVILSFVNEKVLCDVRGEVKQEDVKVIESFEKKYEHNCEILQYEEVLADKKLTAKLVAENNNLKNIVDLFRLTKTLKNELEESLKIHFEEEKEQKLFQQEIENLKEKIEENENQLGVELLKFGSGFDDVTVEILANDIQQNFLDMIESGFCAFCKKNGFSFDVSNFENKKLISISGKGAFNNLKDEFGVYKFVDKNSIYMCQIYVYKKILSEIFQFDDKELKIDVFHSNGAGGQNVNKVETAIRVTHLPTGIVATCQDERSQIQNKIRAITMLKSKVDEFCKKNFEKKMIQAKKEQKNMIENGYILKVFDCDKNVVYDKKEKKETSFERFLQGEI